MREEVGHKKEEGTDKGEEVRRGIIKEDVDRTEKRDRGRQS